VNGHDKIFMQTYTGLRPNPICPTPEDICLEDIAQSLSMLCRFTGHCRRFYTVAEHSIRVADLIYQKTQDANAAFEGLMHDSPEAYINDMSRPLKIQLPEYRKIESQVWLAIAKRFGLKETHSELTKWADNVLVATEGRDLMGSIEGWTLPEPPLEEHIEKLLTPRNRMPRLFKLMFALYDKERNE